MAGQPLPSCSATIMQPLAQQFQQYLVTTTAAPATIKNYVSDISRFLSWLAERLQETTISPAQLTQVSFVEYSQYLNQSDNHLLPTTAQRRLFSLKRFGSWLKESGRLTTDPAGKLKRRAIDPTADQLLNDFKTELEHQKLSPITIKNYLSDLKSYLNWVGQNSILTDNNIIKL